MVAQLAGEMRRLDHAGVYLMIAGSYTPLGLLILDGSWRLVVLSIVWGGVALAILIKVVWVDAPNGSRPRSRSRSAGSRCS